MNYRWMRTRLMVGAVAVAMAPGLAAQQSSPALRTCRAEKDDAQRLACYDRVLDTELRSQPAGDELPVAAPAAVTTTAEERFGQEGVLAREEREKARKEGRELTELHSKVASLLKRSDGALLITLDNGQVWVQKTPDPDFQLRIGEQARITRSAMGSYFLRGNSSWSTRVTRLR